jgi:hypothetical protein
MRINKCPLSESWTAEHGRLHPPRWEKEALLSPQFPDWQEGVSLTSLLWLLESRQDECPKGHQRGLGWKTEWMLGLKRPSITIFSGYQQVYYGTQNSNKKSVG